MSIVRIFRALLVLSLLIASSSHAELYKWTDDKGQVHYSDKQPDDEKVQTLNPQTSLPSGAEKEKSAFEQQVEDMNQRLAEQEKQQQEAAKKAEEEQKRKERCAALRNNMQVLVTKNRVSKMVDGQRVIIPYEERVEKMEKIRKEIDTTCQDL